METQWPGAPAETMAHYGDQCCIISIYLYRPVNLFVLSKCVFPFLWDHKQVKVSQTVNYSIFQHLQVCILLMSFLKNTWRARIQSLYWSYIFLMEWHKKYDFYLRYWVSVLFAQYFSICDKSLVQLGPWIALCLKQSLEQQY